MFLWLVEMTFGLVHASFSLPEWQALKMTFFVTTQLKVTEQCFLQYAVGCDNNFFACTSC